MRLNSWSKITLLMFALATTLLAISFLRTRVEAQTHQPQTVTVKGWLLDLTCAVKGQIMRGAWDNIGEDHMMEDGNIQKNCATLCLRGGQPAALFSDNKITAIFACNPGGSGASRSSLARFVAMEVEVQGYWADGAAQTGIFVPLRIRRGVLRARDRYGPGGGWRDVDCGIMHE